MLAYILSKHFKMINSRLNTFSGIINSLILCRGSNCKHLAEEIKGNIFLESKIKAVSRFLKGEHIEDNSFYSFMEHFLPEGKLILSIDRTIWEFGKNIRNILVITVSYDKIGMPILFKQIPYKGPCRAEDQIEIVKRFIKIYGKERIEAIIGDREFDNEGLINYLDKEDINYVLRIRKKNRIVDESGNRVRIENIDKELRNFKTKFYSVKVKFDQIELDTGEKLSVVSSLGSKDGLNLYKRRWDIEVGFKGCKKNGFRIEETHLRDLQRITNFIKCIFIAFAITIKTGVLESNKRPIAIKRTLLCKSYTLLQYGIKVIKNAYSKCLKEFEKLVTEVLIYAKLL